MEWYSQIEFRRTTVIICWLAACLIGLGLARLKINFSAWLLIVCLILAAVTLRSKNIISVICVVLFGMVLGMWRGNFYMNKLSKYHTFFYQKVSLIGRADSDAVYQKSQLSFDLTNIIINGQSLIGKVGIKGFGANSVFKDDVIKVEGKLYPARGSRQATVGFAKVQVLQTSSSAINNLRRRFQAGLLSSLPEPMASFGLGLLIGQRNNLPQTLNDDLSAVGLTHIVAVSGYNLTIIISAAYFLLKKFSKYQATVMSILLILVFVLFAGFSASIIRAAIVSILSLVAAFYGRNFKPVMLILLAAVITAGWSPPYLWSDIGWYLSFLAFFGILVLAPLVLNRIKGAKEPKLLPKLIIETLSAQIMTIPLVMFIFGQVSLIALPANLLVVPLVPLAMALTFVAAIAGMVVPALAGWFAWPARMIVAYQLNIVSLFAQIPHALSKQNIYLGQLASLYGLIIAVCLILWFKNRSKNVKITDELSEEI